MPCRRASLASTGATCVRTLIASARATSAWPDGLPPIVLSALGTRQIVPGSALDGSARPRTRATAGCRAGADEFLLMLRTVAVRPPAAARGRRPGAPRRLLLPLRTRRGALRFRRPGGRCRFLGAVVTRTAMPAASANARVKQPVFPFR